MTINRRIFVVAASFFAAALTCSSLISSQTIDALRAIASAVWGS